MRRGLALLGMLGLAGLFGSVSGGSAAAPVPAGLYSNSDASVLSVSCAAAGDCVAGGYYVDGYPYMHQAFVVGEANGSWGKPIEVPGTAALNRAHNALVDSVSCPAAGDCVAGGVYTDRSGNSQAFVVSENNGVWGDAIEVPGTATLSGYSVSAAVESVSCGAVGDCAAGGLYLTGSGVHAFVVDETKGVWGDAVEIPGTAAVDTDAYVGGMWVSCAAAGDCAAGGQYTDGAGHKQAFVASEQNGVWGDAIEVPGTGTLNSGGDAGVESVSCSAAGECAAGGQYTDGAGHLQAFVAGETNGSWGDAIEVPGTGTLNTHGKASVSSVSCAAPGDCTAGGFYTDGAGHPQAFVVGETSGSWGDAIEVPGTATLNTRGKASVSSVSCAAAGDCTAVGSYDVNVDSEQTRAFVAGETNGSWGNAGALRKFPVFCAVPSLVGRANRVAKVMLVASNCSVGKIRRVYSRTKYLHVVAQQPKPGTKLKRGAKVALTVSLGRKR